MQKAGSSLVLPVTVTGVPTPKIAWYRGEDQMYAGDGVSLQTTDTASTLTVKPVNGTHSGVYKVTAENKVGSDSAEFTVTIKGECFSALVQPLG